MINRLKSIFHKVDTSSEKELWLKRIKIGTFIDIGAYIGEYVDYAHRLYPKADIYAFEPLTDFFRILEVKRKQIPKLRAYNVALGKKNSKVFIYRSSYGPSSSLLKMNKLHKTAFPFTAKMIKQFTRVRTLDSILGLVKLKPEIFVKIDTQGFEDQVIDGANKILAQTSIIQVEVSFEKLYRGQVLFQEIYTRLYRLGFLFHGIRNQVLSPRDGYILQAHAYFVNPRKVKPI